MDDSGFDPEKTEYTFAPGEEGEETDESKLPRFESVEEFLKEEYELVRGDLDPDDSRRNGNGVWIEDDDRVYQNLKDSCSRTSSSTTIWRPPLASWNSDPVTAMSMNFHRSDGSSLSMISFGRSCWRISSKTNP